MKRKALFIINPISGGKKKDQVPALIKNILDHTQFEATIVYTERAMHGSELAKDAVGKYDYVIAVGGDGTVNEIASAIVGTNVALGVIPFGSGNGLARFLGIPMDTAKSIEAINGERVEDAQDLAHAMNNLKAGDTATVTVWRGKKKVDVKVALQEVRADRRA